MTECANIKCTDNVDVRPSFSRSETYRAKIPGRALYHIRSLIENCTVEIYSIENVERRARKVRLRDAKSFFLYRILFYDQIYLCVLFLFKT